LVALTANDGSQNRVANMGQKFGRWLRVAHAKSVCVMRSSSRCKRRRFGPRGGWKIGGLR
jgi:hypothetical protein